MVERVRALSVAATLVLVVITWKVQRDQAQRVDSSWAILRSVWCIQCQAVPIFGVKFAPRAFVWDRKPIMVLPLAIIQLFYANLASFFVKYLSFYGISLGLSYKYIFIEDINH